MRILMFGRGVIATIYGQAFAAAGHDVEFYVRPGRADVYGEEVRVDLIDARRKRGHQRVLGVIPTRLRESLSPEDAFDLIVLSVGHHRLADALGFLAPRIGNAIVLIFGNVWDEPATVAAPLPVDQVVFGFPQAGGGFTKQGTLHGALLRSVIIGRHGATPSTSERTARDAFLQAGFVVRIEEDMRGRLFLHFLSDAGMFAVGAEGKALAGMIGDRRAFQAALATSRELLPVLRARGVDFKRHRSELLPYRLTRPVAAAMAFATSRVPIARVSLAAHTDPLATEACAILRDTLREANRLGIHATRLESSVRNHAGSLHERAARDT